MCRQRFATAAMFLRSSQVYCLGAKPQGWGPPHALVIRFGVIGLPCMKIIKFDFEKKTSCLLVFYV